MSKDENLHEVKQQQKLLSQKPHGGSSAGAFSFFTRTDFVKIVKGLIFCFCFRLRSIYLLASNRLVWKERKKLKRKKHVNIGVK